MQNQPNEAQATPYSQESEEATLGGILTNPNAFYEVIVFLKPDDFYMLRNRYVYQAMIAITERKEPLDYLTVIQELKAQNRIGEVGGGAYLTTLINNTPTSMHTTVYAHLVQRSAIRRQLMQYGQDVIKAAGDEKTELSEVINKLESKQIDIAARYTGANTQPLKQAISAYYTRLENLMNNPQELLGVPTGFTELDRVFMGFDDQSLTLLGARPGMGKTSMMLSTAMNMAKAGKRVGFFSMEMGVEQLMTRLVAMESGINAQRLRSGQLTQQEWGTFVKVAGDMNELPIFVDDTTIWTPLQLHAKCASMKRRLGLDIIMIDYVGLMSGGGKYKDNKVAESGYISRSLKGMARDLKTAVWAAIQLNRNLEQRQDKRPILSDLRESGDYEQDADNVLFIYRDEVYNEATEFPGQADIIIAKHRNGPVGTVSLYFEKTLTKFENGIKRNIDLSYLGSYKRQPVSVGGDE
jgi:replicative DNA helicase